MRSDIDNMGKDSSKSSYYVWFLGAQEARGLRGLEYITPVVRSLVEREREVEPFKVTLQVSDKGLKIEQNVAAGKQETVKHLIPPHSVTCVHQQEDLVACILLLYNPVTKCPVHVHAYRCDSVATATVLHQKLRSLVDNPDNKKKLEELEARLTAMRYRRKVLPSGSDGRSTRESESSGGSSTERLSGVGQQERIANLYDSLAAELREKLGTSGAQTPSAPILLPPRDYDTVHRHKGNLMDINARRCLSTNIVGINASASTAEVTTGLKPSAAHGKIGSRSGSSGIGSDHAPSPDHDRDARFLDNQSSSDEDWNNEASNDSLFLLQRGGRSGGADRPQSTARRLNSSPEVEGFHRRRLEPKLNHYRSRSQYLIDVEKQKEEPSIHPDLLRSRKQHNSDFSSQPGSKSHQQIKSRRRKNAEERQRSPSPTDAKSTIGSLTPRDRFNDAKEKFLSLEREKQEERERQEKALLSERRRNNTSIEPPILPAVTPVVRSRPTNSWSRSKDSDSDEEELSQHGFSTGNDSYKYPNERGFSPPLRREPSYMRSRSQGRSIPDSEDRSPKQRRKLPGIPFVHQDEIRRKINPSPSRQNSENHGFGIPDDPRRYTSPRREQSPDIKLRKERCTSPLVTSPRQVMRKYPDEEINSRYVGKIPRGHLNLNQVPLAENNSAIPLERYRSPTRVPPATRPSPRHKRYPTPNSEDDDEVRDYRQMMHVDSRNYPPRVPFENNDSKRRSMYESIEDERRRNSNELAKEFKRRSFQEHGPNTDMTHVNSLGYQELEERERYPGLDRDTARPHHADEVATTSPRYRHSYAEPFHHHEMLHRTNSSLSSGRVGMAAIHPY